MKLQIVYLTLILMIGLSVAVGGAYSADKLEAVDDFAITMAADSKDVNKDGYVNVNDIISANAGYELAIKYSDRLPASARRILDGNRDGKITGADLNIVTEGISSAITVNERAKTPNYGLSNTPLFDILFKGQNDLMVNNDHLQKFDGLVDEDEYLPAYAGDRPIAMPDLDIAQVDTAEERIDFGNLAALFERADQSDYGVDYKGGGEDVSGDDALAKNSSDLEKADADNVKIEKLDSDTASAIDTEEMAEFTSFVAKLISAEEYVNDSTTLESFKMTDWAIEDDGSVLFLFEGWEDHAGHTVEVKVDMETGTVLESKETVESYDDEGNLSGSESVARTFDKSGALQVEEYSSAYYNTNGVLTGRSIEGQMFNADSGAMTESYRKAAAKVDVSGKVREEIISGVTYGEEGKTAGAFITELQYNESGALAKAVSSVTVSGDSFAGAAEKKLLIKHSIDEKGKIVGNEVALLPEKTGESKAKGESKPASEAAQGEEATSLLPKQPEIARVTDKAFVAKTTTAVEAAGQSKETVIIKEGTGAAAKDVSIEQKVTEPVTAAPSKPADLSKSDGKKAADAAVKIVNSVTKVVKREEVRSGASKLSKKSVSSKIDRDKAKLAANVAKLKKDEGKKARSEQKKKIGPSKKLAVGKARNKITSTVKRSITRTDKPKEANAAVTAVKPTQPQTPRKVVKLPKAAEAKSVAKTLPAKKVEPAKTPPVTKVETAKTAPLPMASTVNDVKAKAAAPMKKPVNTIKPIKKTAVAAKPAAIIKPAEKPASAVVKPAPAIKPPAVEKKIQPKEVKAAKKEEAKKPLVPAAQPKASPAVTREAAKPVTKREDVAVALRSPEKLEAPKAAVKKNDETVQQVSNEMMQRKELESQKIKLRGEKFVGEMVSSSKKSVLLAKDKPKTKK